MEYYGDEDEIQAEYEELEERRKLGNVDEELS